MSAWFNAFKQIICLSVFKTYTKYVNITNVEIILIIYVYKYKTCAFMSAIKLLVLRWLSAPLKGLNKFYTAQ